MVTAVLQEADLFFLYFHSSIIGLSVFHPPIHPRIHLSTLSPVSLKTKFTIFLLKDKCRCSCVGSKPQNEI